MLVAARILQGAMAALMVPQVLSIVHATFPAHERGKVFGLFGAIVGLGAVSGPLLGALLTEWDLFGLGWRPIFLINLPVGIAGLILGRQVHHRVQGPAGPCGWTWSASPSSPLALLMLLYPLTRGRELDWPLWGYVSMARRAVRLRGAWSRTSGTRPRSDGSPLDRAVPVQGEELRRRASPCS